MFNRLWFLKHQKLLLFFANTWIGRKILCIDGKKSSVGKKKIIHIEPNAIWWRSRGRKVTVEFRTHEKFGKRLYYAFKPFWHLIHFWDMLFANNLNPNWNLGFDTLTAYPVAGASSPCDGYAYRTGVDEAFSSIRTGDGNAANVTNTQDNRPLLGASTTSNQYAHMDRVIFNFDTSSITTAPTVSAAIFSVASGSDAKLANLGNINGHVSGCTPAATNTIANGDYAQVATTSFGNKAYGDWSSVDTTYNDITFNASGIAYISKTGVTSLMLRNHWDMLNDTTGLTWSSGAFSALTVKYADATGTTADPKLVVTYSLPVTGGGHAYFM